jgi:hypothetical protein
MGFSEIFKTGELPSNWSKESLIADGLNGWACCSLGVKPRKKNIIMNIKWFCYSFFVFFVS